MKTWMWSRGGRQARMCQAPLCLFTVVLDSEGFQSNSYCFLLLPKFLTRFCGLKSCEKGDSRQCSSKLNQVNSRTYRVSDFYIFICNLFWGYSCTCLRYGQNFICFQKRPSFPQQHSLLPQCLEMLPCHILNYCLYSHLFWICILSHCSFLCWSATATLFYSRDFHCVIISDKASFPL